MPRKKTEYPDWVMKYKTKGTYINRVGDKYYLYAAHSERIKGTDRIPRVSDGYIGRITQDDGLIRSKAKLKKTPVSFEIGLSYTILSVSSDMRILKIFFAILQISDFLISMAVYIFQAQMI